MQQHHPTCTSVALRAPTSTKLIGRRFSASALRRVREAAGLDRRQLADLAGRNHQSIRLYELDEVQPPVVVADRIARALRIPLDDLLEEEGTPNTCAACLSFTLAERESLGACWEDPRCPLRVVLGGDRG